VKNYLTIGIIGIFVVIIAVGTITNSNDYFGKKEQSMVVNFEDLGSYTVDTTGIRGRTLIAQGTPFTFFMQIRNFDNLQAYFLEEFDLQIPEIKFNNSDKYMAISIGRKVCEMSHNGFLGKPYTPNTFAKAEITFSEEYNENTMYVYVMDKIIFTDSFADSAYTKFYIMKGENKVFLGNTISDINERESMDEGGL